MGQQTQWQRAHRCFYHLCHCCFFLKLWIALWLVNNVYLKLKETMWQNTRRGWNESALSVLQDKLKVGHHGERSLESFCHWQYQEFGGPRYLGTNHVPGGRDDIPPVDTAVLVTRYVASTSSDEWVIINDTCIVSASRRNQVMQVIRTRVYMHCRELHASAHW